MSGLLEQARAKLREQLDWRGPNGKAQGIVTLTRDQAEAVLAGPIGTVAVLDEIGRLALLVKKDEVEAYADAGGMPGIRTSLPEPLPSDSFICTGGKHVHVGNPCPHCGAKERGSVCKLG